MFNTKMPLLKKFNFADTPLLHAGIDMMYFYPVFLMKT